MPGVSRDPSAPAREENFSAVVTNVQKVAEVVSGKLDELSKPRVRPSETRIECGVGVGTETDVLVAKRAGESSFRVTTVWCDST